MIRVRRRGGVFIFAGKSFPEILEAISPSQKFSNSSYPSTCKHSKYYLFFIYFKNKFENYFFFKKKS